MYTQVATKLAVVNGTDQFSSAVAMDGNNAVQVEATVFNLGGATSLVIEVQGSNDQQNWTVITTNSGLVLGYSAPSKSTGIAFAFVRYRFSVTGTGTILVAAGLNTSLQ